MQYDLTCDTCDFAPTVDEEGRAHTLAMEHEREHGRHYVSIETVE